MLSFGFGVCLEGTLLFSQEDFTMKDDSSDDRSTQGVEVLVAVVLQELCDTVA